MKKEMTLKEALELVESGVDSPEQALKAYAVIKQVKETLADNLERVRLNLESLIATGSSCSVDVAGVEYTAERKLMEEFIYDKDSILATGKVPAECIDTRVVFKTPVLKKLYGKGALDPDVAKGISIGTKETLRISQKNPKKGGSS